MVLIQRGARSFRQTPASRASSLLQSPLRRPSHSHQPTPGTEGCRHFIYLPQSFIGIVWHQQLVAAVVTVGVVAAVGAGADAVRVSTNHKFRMVIMVVDLL